MRIGLCLLLLVPQLLAAQTVLQAEDAILFGAYARSDYAGYTGTGYADVVDNYVESTGGYIEFVFRRSSAATDSVTVVYANGASSRNFAVKVNDVAAGTISLPSTGGWTVWSSRKIAVALQAGVNRLRFTTTTKAAYPNVDRIEIAGDAAVRMYRLTLTKSGNGSVGADPSATYYDEGTTVELSATPSGSSFFRRWMGAGDSPANPLALSMTAHRSVVGVFLDTTGTAGFTVEHTPTAFASVNALGNNGTTGGAGGDTITVTTGDELWQLMLLRRDPGRAIGLRPLTVFISGILTRGPAFGGAEMLSVKDAYDLSFVGVGNEAIITGFGLNINRAVNVIVRNITFASCPDDGVAVEADDDEALGHHVWIDHCSFTDIPPPGYPAGSTPDGALDVTHTAAYVTISWCRFSNHDKNCLMGHSDSQTSDVAMKVSYHHNYFDSTAQRNPRVRFGKAHVYNNYYRKNSMYGVSSNMEADVMVEGNYFVNVPIPTETSRDGSPQGDVVERYNTFVNCGVPGTRGTAFEPSTFYTYALDSSSAIPQMVGTYSGAGKHDFSFTGAAATYTLSVNATNGTVTKVPDQPDYPFGTNVQLTANPSPGYHFVQWTGDIAPSLAFTNPVTITMDGNKSLTAVFTDQLRTLTVNAANGTVTRNPDLPSYPQGSQVQLTAVSDGGYFFVGWSGDVPAGHEADNPLTLVMDVNRTLTANFSNSVFTLTTNAVNGSILRDPNQTVFDSGATVQLTAVPDTGYHFVDWSGDATGSANPTTVIMNGNRNVTANFAINQYTLTITAVNGSVTRDPDLTLYNHGTTVTLTAIPAGGYMFSGWSGGASGTVNPTTVLMTSNTSVTALFTSLGDIVQTNGTGGGSWTNPATWQGGAVPTGSQNALILGTDSVDVSSAVSCNGITVTPGGRLRAGAAISAAGTFTLQGASFYYYAASVNLTLPGTVQVLDSASTVLFTTAGTSGGTIAGGTYGNLVIARDANTTPTGPLTINGNLTVNNASGTRVFRGTSGSTSRTNTVLGNVYVSSGTLSAIDAGGGGAVAVWHIGGDVLVSGTTNARLSPFTSGAAAGVVGAFNIAGDLTVAGGRLAYASNNSTSGTGVVNLGGDLTVTAGSSVTDNGSTGPFVFNFTGADTQRVSLGMNFAMATNIYDTVAAGSVVVFENSGYQWGSTAGSAGAFVVWGSLVMKDSALIGGPGSFRLNGGASLEVGHPAGIAATDTTGNIRVTGTRMFSSSGNYGYAGSVAQATGTGLPAAVNHLAIANPAGVLLNAPVTVNGVLSVTSGDLDLNGHTVTLGPVALLTESPGNTVTGAAGVITTERELIAPGIGTDIAGLGVRIGSAGNPGVTTITRGHAVQTGAGGGSITRYFDIHPAMNAGLNATLVFGYDETELNGIVEGSLALYSSADSGATWLERGGAVNPTANTVTITGLDALSRWTAAEGMPAPAAALSPALLGFGNVAVGDSRTDTVFVISVGMLTLQVDSARAAGSAFSVAALAPGPLMPGESLAVAVTFTPPAAGPFSGTLTVYSNAASSPDAVPLTGTGTGGTVSLNVDVPAGWGLVSNPVLTAQDSVLQLFPTSSLPYAWAFQATAGYLQEYRMAGGTGYWAKFPAAGTTAIGGTAVTADTIAVVAGWNLVGSISCSVDTGSVGSIPGGIRISPFYSFDGTYAVAQVIEPGRAYWVKASAPGSLVFSCGPLRAVPAVGHPRREAR